MEVQSLFVLFFAYQIKHFVCDYLLQAPFFSFMKGKFNYTGWVKPLLAHSSIHGLGTFVICFAATGSYIFSVAMTVLDTVFHFVMDRLKASPRLWGKYKIEDPKYWVSLGADQMFHHFTHYLIIFLICAKIGF